MAEERIRRMRGEISAANRIVGAIVALILALALATCAVPSARTPKDIATASAIVKTAVGNAEEAAWRARTFNRANIWDRAAYEEEQVEIILRTARDARERIREAHRDAVAALTALRATARADHGSNVTAAANQVDDIGSLLAAADRHVATIEQTVASLQELDIPSPH